MSALLKSIGFNRSVEISKGNASSPSTINALGFPLEQDIKRISKIEIYSDKENGDEALIVGLRVYYILSTDVPYPVNYGHVHEPLKVGEFTLYDTQILIGYFGRLRNGRVATVNFVLFNWTNMEAVQKGPYFGSDKNLSNVWDDFGEIVTL